MLASIRRAWKRAFYPEPAPPPPPVRFDLEGCSHSILHVLIVGGAGGGKSRLAHQIWAALEPKDRARTYIETGYHIGALEQEHAGADIDYRRERRGARTSRVVCLRPGAD